MLKTRVIPCLLLRGSGLVKTVKFDKPRYLGDPINTVRIFNEKEVDEIVLLDITATREGRQPNFDLIADIASECFMPLGYGGGVTNIEDVQRLLGIGIEKVAINSAATKKQFVRDAVNLAGGQSIVVSIDVKKGLFGKYSVFTQAGKYNIKRDPVDYAREIESLGVGEIMLNSIDRDGTMQGYDIDIVSQISKAVNIPVIAVGGAGKLQDFREATQKGGASAVAAGSMFVYQGKHKAVLISYPGYAVLNKLLSNDIA